MQGAGREVPFRKKKEIATGEMTADASEPRREQAAAGDHSQRTLKTVYQASGKKTKPAETASLEKLTENTKLYHGTSLTTKKNGHQESTITT